jgi:hypothetical protein
MLSAAVNEAEQVLLLAKQRLSRICTLRHGDPPNVLDKLRKERRPTKIVARGGSFGSGFGAPV